MQIAAWLAELNQQGIQLWSDAGSLRYRAAPGKMTDALRQAIAGRKQDILTHLAQERAIPRIDRTGTLPLSHAQERFWFLAQLEPDNPAYNVPFFYTLRGPLHLAALEEAINEIVRRHEILRATCPTIDGRPALHLARNLRIPLGITDLSHRSGQARTDEVERLATTAARQMFDFASGPFLRSQILRLAPDEHVLLVTLHHFVAHGWAMGQFAQELSHLYTAFSTGQPASLSSLPIQYVDFARHEHQQLNEDQLSHHLTYWQQQLADLTPQDLPTDRPRPAIQSYHGATHHFSLPANLTDGLRTLSQQTGVTLFTLLLAGFQILLHRYTQQDDIVLATTQSSRNHTALEPLIGSFANNLVLRTRFPANLTCQDLLQQVRQTVADAYNHQALPFERLVDTLVEERDQSRHPIFQVVFVLHQASAEHILHLPELTTTPLITEMHTTRFDLCLTMLNQAEQLTGALEYSTDLFDAATISRLVKHLQILLTSIVADPEQPVATLPLLSPDEIARLRQWNDTRTDYPKDQTLVTLFETQVARTPDNTAVSFAGQTLSYQQLNTQANQLAHYLRNLTDAADQPLIQPDTLIGICVERSLDMIVGLLGILKAGAAYVPLDPDYPAPRLRFMLEDSQAPALLTQQSLQDRFVGYSGTLVWLDAPDAFSTQPARNPTSYIQPDHLAYVIYTSGSTGQPKGCLMSHHNVTRLLAATQDWYQFTQSDIWTLFHSYAFDFSVWEIWGALAYGGRLVIVPHQTCRDPHAFIDLLTTHQVTVLNQTPSAFNALIQADQSRQTQYALKWIILGGEALALANLEPWFDQHGISQPQLVNMYGLTETTVHTTYQPLDSAYHQQGSLIGRVLLDLKAYILDRYHQPVPIGVPGELCIAGDGLARGYLHQPALTAERFIELELFGTTERVYKTGDLARWLPDGTLDYLGRLDHQIKLRGFRIEPGEIEAVLRQQAAVSEAVVVLYEHGDQSMLVAYITATTGESVVVAELREALQAQLPDYMLPGSITLLEQLPLTPNGKLDRQALPEPAPPAQSEDTALHDAAEQLLANLWSDLLALPVTSRQAHFFELGGHSLLATQLVSRIRLAFAIETPLQIVFEHPVLADLAHWLSRQQGAPRLPEIQPQADDALRVLSYAQQRLWFLHQLEGPTPTYHIPLAYRLEGTLNQDALRQTFCVLVERHHSLRTIFPGPNGTGTVRLLAPYDPLQFSDLSALDESAQQDQLCQLMRTYVDTPFDLAQGPLFRAHLVQLATAQHLLLLNLHHIIADGWSLSILRREWSLLYTAFSQQLKSELTPLTIQYSDYAAWQRDWLQGETLAQQLAYWRSQLQDAPQQLALPTDFPRPAHQSYQGAHYRNTLSPELTAAIHQISQTQNCTLFMTLLSAFVILLYRYTRQQDLLIGTPVAGRTQHTTENIIGCLVNTLVIRTRLASDCTIETLLSQTRATTLAAYAHQDLPFEHLVEALNPERNLSHSPLFQVMLALQNTEQTPLTLPDLQITPELLHHNVARLDLTLSIHEQDNQLHLYWEYATDLFEPERIQRMAAHFTMLLNAMVQDPTADIATLPLLTATEQAQLQGWNATQTDYPKDQTLVSLFAAQVARTPDSTAISFAGKTLSYQQLNTRANQLAHYLRSLTDAMDQPLIQPDTLVGICVERSLEMVIGLLGILKAGAAYVPLDPDYPAQRLRFMLEDCQAPTLLTQQSLQDRFADYPEKLIWLDTPDTVSTQPIHNPVSHIRPDQLAYVIYTSGSTGQPKGVMIEHRSTATLIQWALANTDPASLQGVLAATSITFDLSVYELFVTLCVGGCILLAQDALQLACLPEKHAITLINTVPSVITELFCSQAIPASVRQINLAGEPLTQALAQDLHTLPHLKALYNLYGPSEDTTYSTGACVSQEQRPTIGQPIANTRMYILDSRYQPIPIGVPGALCIAGDGLARGYLHQPALTAERFIELELFGTTERVYKTGDQARWLPDGTLDYLGRLDHQIKLRGFRIEPGEIEAVLCEHDAVREAVVILQNIADHPALAAYVTSAEKDNHTTLIPHLRDWLTTRLPTYMVPAFFTQLDTLPLTPNGKIDRQALPAPDIAQHSTQPIDPQNALEHSLAQCWQNLLALDTVGRHTNFFDCGGNSLIAVRLHQQLQQQGYALKLTDLFHYPTIALLAGHLQSTQHPSPSRTPPRKQSRATSAQHRLRQRRARHIITSDI